MADPYRLLILTEGIPELEDLARSLQTLTDQWEVVAVEEVETAIGRLWMDTMRKTDGRPFHLFLLPDAWSEATVDGVAVLEMLSNACCMKVAPVVLTASATGDRAMAVLRSGGWEYLSLPFFGLEAFSDLMRLLAADVERWWARDVTERGEMGCRDGLRRKMVVQTVIQRFDRRFTLEEVGHQCCVCSRQLHRYFEEELGGSVHDFVRVVRMLAARVLLRETDEPVYAVADRLGVSGQESFTRCFTTRMGSAPTAFRTDMRRRESYFVPQPSGVSRGPWFGGCPRFSG